MTAALNPPPRRPATARRPTLSPRVRSRPRAPTSTAWVSQRIFDAARARLAHEQPSQWKPAGPERIWHCRSGDLPLLAKVELPGDERDDIAREYEIGLLINDLRDRVPNFVSTVGLFTSSPAAGAPALRHLLLERVPGQPIRQELPLQELLSTIVQVTQALHVACTAHQFTHYNLHCHNILLRPLEQDHIINYSPRCRLRSKYIAVLIDFGRSYTKTTGGHHTAINSAEDRPSWEHDIAFLLSRLLKRYYPRELLKLLDFYHLDYDIAKTTTDNLATPRHTQPLARHPDELLGFIEREFGFRDHLPHRTSALPTLTPTSRQPTGSPRAPGLPKVALKIQRQKFPEKALHEIGVHRELLQADCPSPHIASLLDCFVHDGHLCAAYEKHGTCLDTYLYSLPGEAPRMHPADVKTITRHALAALGRLHACGYAHSDIKPENVLWDPATRIAKLADLGNADSKFTRGSALGTRNYLPPEVLLGAQLTPAIDLWALGCTVFELLTGDFLFNPRAAAAEKYREFYFEDDADAPREPTPGPVVEDNRAWAAEQYAPGTLMQGRYRLEDCLGSGTFGTVWSAAVLQPGSLAPTLDVPPAQHQAPPPQLSETEEAERTWRKTHGAKDLKDLVLKYEHLLLIARHFGPLPQCLTSDAIFKASHCEPDGALRFNPEILPLKLRDRLAEHLPPNDALAAADFLTSLLHPCPNQRPSAAQALELGW